LSAKRTRNDPGLKPLSPGGEEDYTNRLTAGVAVLALALIAIDTNSVVTDTEYLAEHLKNADFFDAPRVGAE
jgi:hypothetical protein